MTGLDVDVHCGKVESVKLLLSYGANPYHILTSTDDEEILYWIEIAKQMNPFEYYEKILKNTGIEDIDLELEHAKKYVIMFEELAKHYQKGKTPYRRIHHYQRRALNQVHYSVIGQPMATKIIHSSIATFRMSTHEHRVP